MDESQHLSTATDSRAHEVSGTRPISRISSIQSGASQRAPSQIEHDRSNDVLNHDNTTLPLMIAGRHSQEYPDPSQRTVEPERAMYTEVAPRGRRCRPEQFWITEIVSLVLGSGSFVAILAILGAFEGGLQPNWRHGITINAVIAVLATTLRACLVVVAEQVISQAKWLWFKVSQPANHLAYFDSASRGPLGSLLLPVRIRRLNISLLGVLIVVLSLAISVFTQQAILAVPCNRPVQTGNVSLPLGNSTAQLPWFRYGAGLFDIDPTVKINIINGLTNPSANRSVSASGCTTGNCTFPAVNGITHSFPGVCSTCVNTTSGITLSANGTNLTDPTTYLFWNATGGQPAIQVSSPYTLQSTLGALTLPADMLSEFQGVLPSALFNLSIISLTLNGCTVNETTESVACSSPFTGNYSYNLDPSQRVDSWNVISTSCALYPCIRNSYAEVSNGVFNETTVSEVPMLPDNRAFNPNTVEVPPYVGVNSPCIIDGVAYYPSNYSSIPGWNNAGQMSIQSTVSGQQVPTSCVYGTDVNTGWSLNEFLSSILSAFCAAPDNSGDNTYAQQWALCATNGVTSANSYDAVWLQSLFNSGHATVEGIASAVDAMSTFITDSMRLQGSEGSLYNAYTGTTTFYGNASAPTMLYGTVFQTDVCVRVKWGWLTLPAVLLVFAAVLLVAAVVGDLRDKHGFPVWKSSILPLLYATPGAEMVAPSGANSVGALEEDAKRKMIRLERNDEGSWGFVSGESYGDGKG